MPTRNDLKILQALPLEIKVLKTKQRIREWVNRFGAAEHLNFIVFMRKQGAIAGVVYSIDELNELLNEC